MDYLAHFSFNEEERNGYFTMVVFANDPDEAVKQFRKEIMRLSKTNDILDGVSKIYIDDIIEIAKMPKKAVLTRYESRANDGFGSISSNRITDKGISTYHWHPDDKNEESDEDEEQEVFPFIELGR